MAYGTETPVEDFRRGLVTQVEPSDLPPGAATVAKNITFDELGALRKRAGYGHFIQRTFGGAIMGIVPVHNSFGVDGYLVAANGALEIREP